MTTFELKLRSLSDDELIKAEDNTYSRYLEAKGTPEEGFRFYIWSRVDDEMYRRTNGNPFGERRN